MATPAEVKNDMAAHAAYWHRRDKRIFRACNDAAKVIAMYLDGSQVDGRTYWGLRRRLLDLSSPTSRTPVAGAPNFDRALTTLQTLNAEADR